MEGGRDGTGSRGRGVLFLELLDKARFEISQQQHTITTLKEVAR
jgi:hypothetical protein